MESPQSPGDSSSEEDRMITRQMCERAKTPQEKVLDGLRGKYAELELEIRDIPGKGRGVFTLKPIPKGSFVVEYKTTEVYPQQERGIHEEEYAFNGEGCMILEVETPQGWFCLDATRRHNTLGRLLNHAPPTQATLKPFKPLKVNGKLRVGFLSTRDIPAETELTWDYGCQPKGQRWLMRRARGEQEPSIKDQGPTKPPSSQGPTTEVPLGRNHITTKYPPSKRGPLRQKKTSQVPKDKRRSLPSRRRKYRHVRDFFLLEAKEVGGSIESEEESSQSSHVSSDEESEAIERNTSMGDAFKQQESSHGEKPTCSTGRWGRHDVPFRRHYKFLDTSDDEPGPSLDECCAISCMESHQDPFEDVSKGEVSRDQDPMDVSVLKNHECGRDDISRQNLGAHTAACEEEFKESNENAGKVHTSSPQRHVISNKKDANRPQGSPHREQPTCSTGRGREEVLPFRGYYEFLDSSGDESDALLGDLRGCCRENGLDFNSSWKFPESPIEDADEFKFSRDEDPTGVPTLTECRICGRCDIPQQILANHMSACQEEVKGSSENRDLLHISSPSMNDMSSDEGDAFSHQSSLHVEKPPRSTGRRGQQEVPFLGDHRFLDTSDDKTPAHTAIRKRSSRGKGKLPSVIASSDDNDNPTGLLSTKLRSSKKGQLPVITVSSDSETDKVPKRKRVDKRYFRICPVPGCRSAPQKKLSQHMSYKHPEIEGSKRRHLLAVARRVPKRKGQIKPSIRTRNQPTLHQFLRGPTPTHSEESEVETPQGLDQQHQKGTRHYERFDLKDPSLVQFRRYLLSIDGGSKGEKTALEATVDISKYLRYACGPSITPHWARLTDRDQLLGYMEKLKRSGVGPEGRLGKLDVLSMGLKFFKVAVASDLHSPLYTKACHMQEVLLQWKATLRKEKRKLSVKRLEALSSEPLSLEEVTQLVECDEAWENFDEICTRAKRGEPVATEALNRCSALMATTILYKSWQRPGAIANCTCDELKAAKLVTRNGTKVYVISVHDHKTGREGTAKLVLDGVDFNRLRQYIICVRPLQDSENSSKFVIVLSGGKQLNKVATRIRRLGNHYGLTLPTPTRVRKIGATTVSLNVGTAPEAALITRQLSHAALTEQQYYQAIIGDEHAAMAYTAMESLRKGKSSTSQKRKAKESLPAEKPKRCKTQKKDVPEEDNQPPRRKIMFTEEESQQVLDYFDSYVAAGDTPSLGECAQFLKDNPLPRNAKQIQDKVKTLRKKYVKEHHLQ